MGSDEGQRGDSWPGEASPPQESTPAPGHPAAAPSAWVVGSWSRRSLTLCPGPPLPAPGRALTPTLPLVWEEAGAGAGWRVRALPRPWEKGAFVEPGPLPPPSPPHRQRAHSWAEAWPPQPALGRGAEARGRGGDSQWASVAAHKRPLWPSSRPSRSSPRGPARPAPSSPAQPSPVVQHCPRGHPPLRAPRPLLLSRGCHPHSPGACSVSRQGEGAVLTWSWGAHPGA